MIYRLQNQETDPKLEKGKLNNYEIDPTIYRDG